MVRRRTLVTGLLLALIVGACGADPAPSEPPGTASAEACAALHWYDVRDALATLDHYTYRSIDHIVFLPIVPGEVPIPTDRTMEGAYRAPDRASELSDWAEGTDPMARTFQHPDLILIGDEEWSRIPLVEDVWHAVPGRSALDPEGGLLDDHLTRLNARAWWSTGEVDPDRPADCVFRIDSATAPEGRHFDAALWADAATLIPSRLVRHEYDDPTGSVSTFETTIDPSGDVPVEPPDPAEIEP
jgi:hypothetical protein